MLRAITPVESRVIALGSGDRSVAGSPVRDAMFTDHVVMSCHGIAFWAAVGRARLLNLIGVRQYPYYSRDSRAGKHSRLSMTMG